MEKKTKKYLLPREGGGLPTPSPAGTGFGLGGIVSGPGEGACLDTQQLGLLEQSFRQWAEDSPRRDVRLSRRRILLVFLLIRSTGAKLNEILALDPFTDIDPNQQTVCIRDPDSAERSCGREISIAGPLTQEIRETLADPLFRDSLTNLLAIDPAFVRRKFYERAEACGFAKRWGGPEMLRRARAVELLQGNMPLPAVQQLLGHSTPNLTTAHVSFSAEELQRVTRLFVERESSGRTSARNTFFGKIIAIQPGDIQSLVCLISHTGHQLTAMITNTSRERLGLQVGRLVTAEVKAPWVILHQGEGQAPCSAENRFQGEVVQIHRGQVSSEVVVTIGNGMELCAVVSTLDNPVVELKAGDSLWALFNCFAVILHAD